MDNPDNVYATLGNNTVRTSLHDRHPANFISNNSYDRNIKEPLIKDPLIRVRKPMHKCIVEL